MFLHRGFEFTHETVRDWEARFAPLVADKLRAKRKGQAGRSWHVDETYIRVAGVWKYLYRAIDRDGNLVDSMLSDGCGEAVFQRCVGARRAGTGASDD
jgi:transposase-like protein